MEIRGTPSIIFHNLQAQRKHNELSYFNKCKSFYKKIWCFSSNDLKLLDYKVINPLLCKCFLCDPATLHEPFVILLVSVNHFNSFKYSNSFL